VPSAQLPSQLALFPAHVTWQGGASQANVQLAPCWQVHSPFAQAPVQVESSPQLTWQGGALHANSQLAPRSQLQEPLAQAPLQVESCSQASVQGGEVQVLTWAHAALTKNLSPHAT
jgi:hypothetical protein